MTSPDTTPLLLAELMRRLNRIERLLEAIAGDIGGPRFKKMAAKEASVDRR